MGQSQHRLLLLVMMSSLRRCSRLSILFLILLLFLGDFSKDNSQHGSSFLVGAFMMSPQTSSIILSSKYYSTGFPLSMANNKDKKKTKQTTGGKGFGKVEAPPPPPPTQQNMEDVASATNKSNDSMVSSSDTSDVLKSVPNGSSSTPTIDDNVPVEERTKAILREGYGMRTREEQLETERRQKAVKEQRQKLQSWKQMADEGQDFDLMKALPEPLLIGIDRFLKVGVAMSTVLFVLAGVLITIEAYSKTTGQALPENLDNFIVQTVEPNFTPGLLVLLGFSVSLGAFAAAQLSSASSNYREDR